MIYTSPNEPDSSDNKYSRTIFLAGPIIGAPKWQETIADRISNAGDFNVFNPRRPNLDSKDFVKKEQIEWEEKYLELADYIIFYIPEAESETTNRTYGQTSRIEFGEWFGKLQSYNRFKKVLVCMYTEFPSYEYITHKINNDKTGRIKSFDTIDEIIDYIVSDSDDDIIKQLDISMLNYDTLYFTADTHFGQERTLELSCRPFKDIDEMNSVIIKNWNDKVSENSVVIHLGDFGDNYEYVKALNGRIILICGNYEYTYMKEHNLTEDDFSAELLSLGFVSVVTEKKVILDIDDITLTLCHEPENYNPKTFNIFGHIHRLQVVKKFGLNVGTDGNHFRPYSLEDVKFQMNGIKNHYDHNVFM